MSSDPKGILAYGYDLGGADGQWKLAGANEYGTLDDSQWPDWCRDDDDFTQRAEDHLANILAGFTETDWHADGYFDRKKAANAVVGVTLRSHGHSDMRAYMLVTHYQSVEWDDTALLDPAELVRMPADGDWDSKLAAAIAALGITPTQARPGWLLAASYG